MAILVGIIVFQFVVVQFLNIPFKLYEYGGLTLIQWLISIGIGLTVIPLSIFLRLLPIGKEAVQQDQENPEKVLDNTEKVKGDVINLK